MYVYIYIRDTALESKVSYKNFNGHFLERRTNTPIPEGYWVIVAGTLALNTKIGFHFTVGF